MRNTWSYTNAVEAVAGCAPGRINHLLRARRRDERTAAERWQLRGSALHAHKCRPSCEPSLPLVHTSRSSCAEGSSG